MDTSHTNVRRPSLRPWTLALQSSRTGRALAVSQPLRIDFEARNPSQLQYINTQNNGWMLTKHQRHTSKENGYWAHAYQRCARRRRSFDRRTLFVYVDERGYDARISKEVEGHFAGCHVLKCKIIT